jgi:hypothetical protein
LVGAGVELLAQCYGGNVNIKPNSVFVIAFTFALGILPAISCAQDKAESHTPFDSYFRAANIFFVYDSSQYSPYNGPDISHWNLTYSDVNPGSVRKRWGIFSITKTQRVYVDEIWDPMSAHIQLIDINNNKLIHEFIYDYQIDGALLFSGQGAVYQYFRPKYLCSGGQTKKFWFQDGNLVEVQQPFAYLANTETTLISDVTLFFSSSAASGQIATLKEGSSVSVLAIDKGYWFLIKTPLGLTGWVEGGSLLITRCN